MEQRNEVLTEIDKDFICNTIQGRPIKPKTLGQKDYVEQIRKKMIVFGVGPAGTGKTYLAMAMAVTAFRNEEVSRIILTRPAIEAGEKLGFLPGDLQSKIDPYLRPLYDALYQIMAAARYAMRLQPRTAGFGLSIRRKTAERAAREISAQSPLRANISIIWIPTIKLTAIYLKKCIRLRVTLLPRL